MKERKKKSANERGSGKTEVEGREAGMKNKTTE